MTVIPFINRDTSQIAKTINDKLQDTHSQRKIVLVIVSVALLLDNMLYMVIVPIIPDYLRSINAWGPPKTELVHENYTVNVSMNATHSRLMSEFTTSSPNGSYTFTYNNSTQTITKSRSYRILIGDPHDNEDIAVGVLFASKAIIQLLVNPLSGTIIDRIGYDLPMLFGLSIIFVSTTIFAFGQSYAVLFVARSLQGVGSAFADTSGLAMIADRFHEERERTKALGIALAFISFGCLVAPPFGGILYEFAGKKVPFLLLASIAIIDGLLMFLVMKPARMERNLLKTKNELPKGTPIYRLLMDPYIAVVAGALAMSNVSLAFLEPTLAIWMKDTMNSTEWEMGLVWLPAFIPHVIGVYMTVKLAASHPKHQWLIAAIGLAIEGLSCIIIPFTTGFAGLVIPLMTICFGIALVDTALLPTLAHLVDTRHVSVYGSIYAIADISYCFAYAFGPIVAGQIVQSVGYMWLNMGIMISTVLYAPILFSLRVIYRYTQFENEGDVLLNDPPGPEYKTYMLEQGKGEEVKQVEKNHLNHSRKFKTCDTVGQVMKFDKDGDTQNIIESSDSEY